MKQLAFEGAYQYAHDQHLLQAQKEYQAQIDSEIAAACTEYARSREIQDEMDAASIFYQLETKRINDSIINDEIIAACTKYAQSREFEDANRYSIQQHILEGQKLYDEQVQSEILAMSAKYAAERRTSDSLAWVAQQNEMKTANTLSNENESIVLDAVSIQLYPNPVIESVNVEIQGGAFDQNEVGIYDVNGKVVSLNNLYTANLINIDVTSLSPGYYIVKYSNEKGMEISKKFFKQ